MGLLLCGIVITTIWLILGLLVHVYYYKHNIDEYKEENGDAHLFTICLWPFAVFLVLWRKGTGFLEWFNNKL